MSVSNPTRIEIVRDLLISKYQEITVANGFRQTIAKVDGSYLDPRDTQKFPIIQVYFGEMRIEKLNQSWSVVDIKTKVYVVGQVKGRFSKLSDNPPISERQNEVFKMMSDLGVKTGELVRQYASDGTNDFVFMLNDSPITIFPVPDFAQQDVVSVFCTYGIKIRNIDFTTFA